jgi:hypothetical protein
MNSLFDWTPYQDETLYGPPDLGTPRLGLLHGLLQTAPPPEFAGHKSGTAQPSVFRVVHDEPQPSAGERSSFANFDARPPAHARPHLAFMYHRTAAGKGPRRCAVPSQLRGNRRTLRYFTAPGQATTPFISWCHSPRRGADALEQFRCCPRMLLRTATTRGRASIVRRSGEPDNNQRCGNSHYCNAVNELIKPL